MRREEREITDPAALRDVLNRATVCHLALSDGGRPYIVPMNFGYEGDALYFHAATEGMKLDILRRNDVVCFQVETDVQVVMGTTSCKCSAKYRSVIGFGKAVFVEDPAEKRRALDIITRHYIAEAPPMPEATVARTCVFRVDIESMTGKQVE